MIFENINIHNFLSIGQAIVPLNNRGLVLIEGKNLDDPSAKSNGSGKSSLVDALCWVLYGKTARGVSTDDVVNRKAKKNCSVSLTITDNGGQYFITRYRKTKDGSGVSVHFKPDSEDELQELTKGTMTETQSLIEEIIGCPYNVFVASVYAGQDAMPDLPAMTDKQLKELIESVIGVERLSKAYEQCLVQKRTVSNELTIRQNKVELKNQALENTKYDLEQLEKASKKFELDAKDHKEALRKAMQKAKDEFDSFAKKHSNTDALVATMNDRIAELENLRTKRNQEYQEQLKALTTIKEKHSTEVANAFSAYQFAKRQAETLANEYKNIEAKIGTKCKECGKVYTADDLEEARTAVSNQLKTKINETKSMKSQWEEKIRVKEAEEEKFSLTQPDFTDLIKERNQLMAKVNSAQEVKYQLKTLQTKHEMATSEYEKFSTENSYLPMIEGTKTRIEEQTQDLSESKKEIQTIEEDLQIWNRLIEVFGPTGVRQHILETITPVLNDRTARYLDVLSDGKLTAVWSTLTTTKKGEVKEKFNISVNNSVGGSSFDSLSGGEKRKVRVACCLALQELVASRATKPIELFIADEVDHALDEAGVERLIGVLNEKSMICKSLFVISHNPLRNWIDNAITVVKKDGISHIE